MIRSNYGRTKPATPPVAGQFSPIALLPTQGPQFTSPEFTGILESHGIRISMDGRGPVFDNIFIERLWLSVKYEEVYLHEYQTVAEAKKRLGEYFRFYNGERLHEALDYRPPSEVYFGTSASLMPTAAMMA